MPWLLRFLCTLWDSWMLEGISIVFHKILQYSVPRFQPFLYDMYVKVKVTTWHAYEGTAGIGGIALTHLQPSCWKEWVVSAILWPFYPWERTGIHCTGGLVSLGANLDGYKKNCIHWDWSLDCPACSEL